METQAQIALGRIEIEADLRAARVHSVAYVGNQATQATQATTIVSAWSVSGSLLDSSWRVYQASRAIHDQTSAALQEMLSSQRDRSRRQ